MRRESYLFGGLGGSPGVQGHGLIPGIRKRGSVMSVGSNCNAESAISPPSRHQIRKNPLPTPGFGGGGQNSIEKMENTGDNTSMLGLN